MFITVYTIGIICFFFLSIGIRLGNDESSAPAFIEITILLPIFGRIFGWW